MVTFIYREVVKVGQAGRWRKLVGLATDLNVDILLLLVYALAHRSPLVPNMRASSSSFFSSAPPSTAA
jgi:hypothetical protein